MAPQPFAARATANEPKCREVSVICNMPLHYTTKQSCELYQRAHILRRVLKIPFRTLPSSFNPFLSPYLPPSSSIPSLLYIICKSGTLLHATSEASALKHLCLLRLLFHKTVVKCSPAASGLKCRYVPSKRVTKQVKIAADMRERFLRYPS